MVFFLGEFWWICVAEGVSKIFGGFEGEACRFPGSEGVIQILWVGFVDGGLFRVYLVGRGGGGERDVGGRRVGGERVVGGL